MPDRLILCLDGTWNSPFRSIEREDGTQVLKPANPLKLARAVLPLDDEGNRQLTYYDSGVGALGLYPGISNRLLHFFDNKLGGAFGAGFEANVEQATNFIVGNYTPGADIYIFGFSRGAAQARALTNFLNWLGGIPQKRDAYYVPVFFRHYLTNRGSGTPKDIVRSDGYVPADHFMPFEVKMLGVWDTVMALGSRLHASANTSVAERSFHVRARPAECIRHARQALAKDERRYDFRPEIWMDRYGHQTLEQRWFPGMHAHVGGSYDDDGLANTALHWIANEASALGMSLDGAFLKKYHPFPQDKMKDSYTFGYKALDAMRLRFGDGARSIEGHPATATLSLDPSVIKRLCSDPNKVGTMTKPYRPKDVVKMVASHRDNWEHFLRSYGFKSPSKFPFPDDI